MASNVHVPLFDLLSALSDTMDMISPALAHHHLRVTYIAHSIAGEMGLPADQHRRIIMAAALHDIGAFSLQHRKDLLGFEVENPSHHCRAGYWLLNTFEPFEGAARLVRFHHVRWEEGVGAQSDDHPVPLGSHILHLADRIAVLIDSQEAVLLQAKDICSRVCERSGKMFHPELVDAFMDVAHREFFWFDAASSSIQSTLRTRLNLADITLDIRGQLSLGDFFRRIIDFKSPYTADHSSGVAACAELLARAAGFSDEDSQRMRVASYLHDLGKLAIPSEILEKPARLTSEEYSIMEAHVYHTYRILEHVADLQTIRDWSGFHQERLDGSGYPFHLKAEELSEGARILAVADVFTALTEDRPYRAGMSLDEALSLLNRMVEKQQMDGAVLKLLRVNLDEINAARIAAQQASHEEYSQFVSAVV